MLTFYLAIYAIALLMIFIFSINQIYLALNYKKTKKKDSLPTTISNDKEMLYPKVAIQLPIFNEKYVAERLLDAICKIEYPLDLLEVQILDDSTDETVEIIAKKVAFWKTKGVNITQIRRKIREGYKAGALKDGLQYTDATFIAIFDSDFVPNPDFLKKTIPVFKDKKIGLVQTRWGHLNKNYSTMTRMQAFGLDAHFTIEQVARSACGGFINFNGTGGIWRRECIEKAGGWTHDTLTEDLDLSYRAQLKGYQFTYLEDVVTPAELPIIMTAIKSQQYRWNKGAAENVIKNLPKVFKNSKLSLRTKLLALFHLTNSSIFVMILLAAILSVPITWIKFIHPELSIFFNFSAIFMIGFFSISYFYYISEKSIHRGQLHFWTFLKNLITFLTIFLGLSLHNSIAVIEGFARKKTPFIRTPKFNKTQEKHLLKKNIYLSKKIPFSTYLEGLLCLYFGFGIFLQFKYLDFGLIMFQCMLCIGFGIVFIQTLKSQFLANS